MFLRNFNIVRKYNVIKNQTGCIARIQFYLKSLQKYWKTTGRPYIETSGGSTWGGGERVGAGPACDTPQCPGAGLLPAGDSRP